MEHVAIDLGGRESQICVRNEAGVITEERRVSTSMLGAFLSTRPGRCRVILETCSEAFGVADEARELGHDVRVVPATLVRQLGVGARGVKTDRRDAQALSQVSCRVELGSVHIPSHEARERKSMLGMRDALVSARTMLVNSVRGYLRGRRIKLRSGSVETFHTRARAATERTGLANALERQFQAIEHLTKQIADADTEVDGQAKHDPICERLMTVPGVGPKTAMRFVATLDGVARFENSAKVASYLGLVPGERSSSSKQVRTGLTKAGSSAMRWLLVQAAWVCIRSRRRGSLQEWALQVAARRGKRVAVVALARKLSGLLYAIWRDGTRYNANKAVHLPVAPIT